MMADGPDEPFKNMFGDPIDLTGARRGKHYRGAKGFAAPPGSGPAGETCGSCRHLRRVGSKPWPKCALVKWSNGRATDVLVRAAACDRWEAPDEGAE